MTALATIWICFASAIAYPTIWALDHAALCDAVGLTAFAAFILRDLRR